jgi:hypothetical protein
MAAIDKVCDRRIDAAAMRSVLEATSRLPPVSLARFVFAAAAGAAALGVIFGATHPLSLLLIAFSSVPFCGSLRSAHAWHFLNGMIDLARARITLEQVALSTLS